MADENTIIEGTVKFRDGKKWKSRWCVMRKLSPVADCVQLQLYRSARGSAGAAGGGGARGACCAALSLQQFVAAESGFTLDKHSNTLALVCKDLVAVLAFETRERLIQWQVKAANALGEGRSHVVVVRGGAVAAGPARLHVRAGGAALTAGVPPRLLRHWELQHLRRYGVVDGRFCFEGGSLCGKGEGLHVLVADRPQDIVQDFERAARARLSPRRRPLTARRTDDGAVSEAGDESIWRATRPEGGAEDAVSLQDQGESRVALERCMSCMSKLGAMSRSSTAALTPGAKHFSPAWTMEALSEPPPRPEETPLRPRAVEVPVHARLPTSLRGERPVRPARLPLPRACSCGGLADELSSIGPYENYDVPRVPSTEVEGEYYDTPKRLRECMDGDLFKITRSSTANTLILKKPCGCLLRLGRRRREPKVVDAKEDLQTPCPCRRVTDWANSWMKLPYCRRSATSSDLSASDKENMTPDTSALYATVDFSRKTRRRTCGGRVEIDDGPLAHYENLNFALSLEHYENAKDMLRKAGVTQAELESIGANLRPAIFTSDKKNPSCTRCHFNRPQGPSDEYLMMEPAIVDGTKEPIRAPPAGYTPMSPISGFQHHTLRHPARSPVGRLLEEKSASNPALGAVGGDSQDANTARRALTRPRSSSADSSRFLDDVKEFDGSGGGSASSLETLRDAGGGSCAAEGKLSDVDSSEASKGRCAASSPTAAAAGGARDSSSSADSGVSSWSLRPPADRELPRCSATSRRHWRASRRPTPPREPRPRSSDGVRVSPPPETPKSSSAEAEVPLLALRSLRGGAVGTDSRSTSSGASDMSDYIETLSLCSSHSSTDTPVTMRAGVSSTLRPRSGKEYARLQLGACAALRSAAAPDDTR